jgi:SAM-dependent methyltransferase
MAGMGLLLECDLPVGQEGTIAHNELVLSGWAVSPLGISGVAVQIGDRVWNASYGLDTPELAAQVGEVPNVTRAGYRLCIDTSRWTPGPHYVTVAAFDMEGGRSAVEGTVEVQPFDAGVETREPLAPSEDQLTIQLDEPLSAAEPRELTLPLRVTGWASAASGIEAVVVTLDGKTQYEALRPIARPDLLDSHGPDVAANAGFALQLDPGECPPGLHTLTVVASARDGKTAGLERELTCRSPDAPETPPEPGTAAQVEWLEQRAIPQPRDGTDGSSATDTAWRERALLAEADAAASRAAARLARKHQESALRARRVAEQEIERSRLDAEAARAELFAAPRVDAVRLALEHHARYGWAARLVSAGRVLDAGCGTGSGTARLAEHAHAAVGVDVSPGAIADARQRHGDEASFVEGDMRSLPFEAGEFDFVVCFEAFAHVAETELVLDELRRVLRPGGTLLVSSPNRGAYPTGNPLHLAELTADELEQALAARFANVATHRQQTYFASLLGTAATLGHADPRVQIEADVTKLVGTPPGQELYSVAVATDGSLPPEPARLVLGEQLDYEQQARELAAWQRRTIDAETDALVLRRQLQD